LLAQAATLSNSVQACSTSCTQPNSIKRNQLQRGPGLRSPASACGAMGTEECCCYTSPVLLRMLPPVLKICLRCLPHMRMRLLLRLHVHRRRAAASTKDRRDSKHNDAAAAAMYLDTVHTTIRHAAQHQMHTGAAASRTT
jgi:hypothetical protein